MAERSNTPSIDPQEVAKFEAMSAEWWDPEGPFRPLHRMNPLRLDYISRQIEAEFDRNRNGLKPFSGLSLIDIGCGGGLLSEPMARLGASVVGIDAAGGNIPVAQAHAAQSGLSIDYRAVSAEAVLAAGERFDVVLAMEVVEHVADPAGFLSTCSRLLRPGGLLICSTLNRTAKAYAIAIVGAERILKWLPAGTHDWSKFMTPRELDTKLADAGLDPVDCKGMVFNPLTRAWSLSASDRDVNYVVTAVKPT